MNFVESKHFFICFEVPVFLIFRLYFANEELDFVVVLCLNHSITWSTNDQVPMWYGWEWIVWIGGDDRQTYIRWSNSPPASRVWRHFRNVTREDSSGRCRRNWWNGINSWNLFESHSWYQSCADWTKDSSTFETQEVTKYIRDYLAEIEFE